MSHNYDLVCTNYDLPTHDKKKNVFLMWRKLAYVRSVGKERDRECDWDMTDLNL